MTRPHFTDDFKIDAIKQITEHGYSVADVSKRLGVSTHSLYAWMKRFSKPLLVAEDAVEVRRLK
jgi:transposase